VYAKGPLRNSAAYWWLRACSLRVVEYKIQNTWLIQRLEASLILNIFVVGRTCWWLFDHDTRYSRAKQLLDGSLFQFDFAQASTLLPPFSRFWTSAIETEVWKKEYLSLLSFLRRFSFQQHICIMTRSLAQSAAVKPKITQFLFTLKSLNCWKSFERFGFAHSANSNKKLFNPSNLGILSKRTGRFIHFNVLRLEQV